jgi:hypothetical protein
MSDQSGPLPELTAEQESQVRRLLAEARHEEPIPAAVGERLDRVLAELSPGEDDARGPEPVAPVVDLAARRRRRNAAVLLAGAAAVIVAGFGIGQVIDVGGAADDANTSTAGDAGGGRTLADDDGGEAAAEQAAPTDAGQELPLTLSSSNLRSDVEKQLGRLRTGRSNAPEASLGAMADAYGCSPTPSTAYGAGQPYPALYDGVPTVVVLRPAIGGQQVVEVLQCGSGAALAKVTVDAP